MNRTALDLEHCYAECRRVLAAHGSTYQFAARFFPPDVRRSIYALYGFVRLPDEMVDNPPEAAAGELDQTLALRAWRDEFDRSHERGWSDHPVMHAFVDTVARHDIPVEYVHAFLDSMLMDVSVRRYQTFDDLQRYTYGSASVIGLMICCIVGTREPGTLPYAADLGLAMQLTNFLRDIREDHEARDRVYIPCEDLERFCYTVDDLAEGVVNDNFRALMRFEIERNREIYARAEPGIALLPQFARYPVRMAGGLYAAILDRIEAQQYDIFTRRASTSRGFKLRRAIKQWGADRVRIQLPLVPR